MIRETRDVFIIFSYIQRTQVCFRQSTVGLTEVTDQISLYAALWEMEVVKNELAGYKLLFTLYLPDPLTFTGCGFTH